MVHASKSVETVFGRVEWSVMTGIKEVETDVALNVYSKVASIVREAPLQLLTFAHQWFHSSSKKLQSQKTTQF